MQVQDLQAPQAPARLDPLSNPLLNSVYNSLEENAKYARLAWFYTLLMAPILALAFFAAGSFAQAMEAGTLGVVGIVLVLLLAGYGAAIISLGVCHLLISDLRTRLRRADSELLLFANTHPQDLSAVIRPEFLDDPPALTAAKVLSLSRRQAMGIRIARYYVQILIGLVMGLLLVVVAIGAMQLQQARSNVYPYPYPYPPAAETPAAEAPAAEAAPEAPAPPATDPYYPTDPAAAPPAEPAPY